MRIKPQGQGHESIELFDFSALSTLLPCLRANDVVTGDEATGYLYSTTNHPAIMEKKKLDEANTYERSFLVSGQSCTWHHYSLESAYYGARHKAAQYLLVATLPAASPLQIRPI